MIQRTEIVRIAREYVGTPFHHQARLKGVGIDCIGLIVCVGKDLGFDFKDCTNYPWRADGVTLKKRLDEDLIVVDNPDLGDILLFWSFKPDIPTHVGIKTDRGMVHAYAHEGAKRVVESGIDKWWTDRLVAVYQFPGVE